MDQGRQFETAGIIFENRVLIYQVDVCMGIHFFVGEFPVTALQSGNAFALKSGGAQLIQIARSFFSSYIKSSGIIDELSLKN